jgi:undecaprenyl-diphosphatase
MTAPAGVAGLVLERSIERHLGHPSTIAAGLLLGAMAMVAADRAPESRQLSQVGARDGLSLGLAQACALFPGISRTGATLTAARLRGFRRQDAWRLSLLAATPVIAGATALKLARLRQGVPGSRQEAALSAGAAGSFASTLVLTRLIRPSERSWPLLPFAVYRAGLGLAMMLRLRRAGQPSGTAGGCGAQARSPSPVVG